MIKSSAYAVTPCSNCPLAWSDEKECYYKSMCWHPMVKDQMKDIDDVGDGPRPTGARCAT